MTEDARPVFDFAKRGDFRSAADALYSNIGKKEIETTATKYGVDQDFLWDKYYAWMFNQLFPKIQSGEIETFSFRFVWTRIKWICLDLLKDPLKNYFSGLDEAGISNLEADESYFADVLVDIDHERKRKLDKIVQAMKKLEKNCRKVLKLRIVAGFKHKEIARRKDIPWNTENSVKTNYVKCKNLVREIWNKL